MFHYICKILPIKSRNKTFMFMWNKAQKILHPLTCINFDMKEAFSRQEGNLNLTSLLCAFGFDCLTVKPLSKILYFFLVLTLWNKRTKPSHLPWRGQTTTLEQIFLGIVSYFLLSMPQKKTTVSTVLFRVFYSSCWSIHCFNSLMLWQTFKYVMGEF